MASPVLLTADQAAEHLHIPRRQVNRLAASGLLPTYRKMPGIRGARLFRLTDVKAVERRLGKTQ